MNKNIILGLAVLVLVVIGIFAFGTNRASYVAAINDQLDGLDTQLIGAKDEIAAGITVERAVVLKGQIAGRLDSINDTLEANAKNTKLTPEQRQEITVSLTRIKVMIENYIETLSLLDKKTAESSSAGADRLTEVFNEVVNNFEDHVENIEETVDGETNDEQSEGDNEDNEEISDTNSDQNVDEYALSSQTWIWVETVQADEEIVTPNDPDAFELSFNSNTEFSVSTDCNGVGGSYLVEGNTIEFKDFVSTLMFCEGSQESDFREMLEHMTSYAFTASNELVLYNGLGGVMRFR